MHDVTYLRKGVPLEDYVLTRTDHRGQKQAEECVRWAQQTVDRMVTNLQQRLGPEGFLQHGIELQRDVRAILAGKTPDDQLMRWRLRLYCGHIVIGQRHANTESPTMHGSSSQACPECGMDPASIVAYEPVGLVQEPAPRSSPPPRPTRRQLEQRISELESENEQLRRR